MPWRSASGRTVPWGSASELSRWHLKGPVRLVRPDAQDAIFFPNVVYIALSQAAFIASLDGVVGRAPYNKACNDWLV